MTYVGGSVPEAEALNVADPYAPPVATLAKVMPFILTEWWLLS